MDFPIHADIFYVVTTVAIVLITAGLAMVLIHLFPLIKNLRQLSDKASAESDKVLEDFRIVRMNVVQNIMETGSFLHFLQKFLTKKVKNATQTKKKSS